MSETMGRPAPARPQPVDITAEIAAAAAAPFDLAAFCTRLTATRVRTITHIPVFGRAPRGGCRPWPQAGEADYVLVEQNTTLLHRDLLALHTVGHLLLAHHGRPVPADVLARRMPDLDWQQLRTQLGPVVYLAGPHPQPDAEAHADAFAVAVLQHAGRLRDPDRPTAAPAGAGSAFGKGGPA